MLAQFGHCPTLSPDGSMELDQRRCYRHGQVDNPHILMPKSGDDGGYEVEENCGGDFDA
jgi:hypothetical protein